MSKIEATSRQSEEEPVEFSWLHSLAGQIAFRINGLPIIGRLGEGLLIGGGSIQVPVEVYSGLLVLTFLIHIDRPLPKIRRRTREAQRRHEQTEKSLRKGEERKKIAQKGHWTARKDSSLPGAVYDHNFDLRGAGSRLPTS